MLSAGRRTQDQHGCPAAELLHNCCLHACMLLLHSNTFTTNCCVAVSQENQRCVPTEQAGLLLHTVTLFVRRQLGAMFEQADSPGPMGEEKDISSARTECRQQGQHNRRGKTGSKQAWQRQKRSKKATCGMIRLSKTVRWAGEATCR